MSRTTVKPCLTGVVLPLATLLLSLCAGAAEPDGSAGPGYVFAWPFIDTAGMAPRGGTTTGPDMVLDGRPADAFVQRTDPALPDFERDRQAILGMAGDFRTSFDFLEVAGFTPGFVPARPYRSWGVETVRVIADEERFISLQHILVMRFVAQDGTVSEPIVVKHWRQDWRYEDRSVLEYVGHDTWQRRELPADAVAGTWTQAVYHVDDSPRYESYGRWQHNAAFSAWESRPTDRPLPRREFSVRDDYHMLRGTNRHTIVPTGWLHEQDNLKTVLDEHGELDAERPYLAREAGVNRYERVRDHDFTPADTYWQRTAAFWAAVREAWDEVTQRHRRV
ncbi:MAG: DUF6607 family protein, partial [Gammaproteobacteria bacterium]